MIAEIIKGTLVLMPGNETEEYALISWLGASGVSFSDTRRMETVYIRGSCVKICATIVPTFVPPAGGAE